MKRYYGLNWDDDRVMTAVIVGEMADGTKVYNEILPDGTVIKDKQYSRTLKYGTQLFVTI